jgi:uncharacterized protein YuzE
MKLHYYSETDSLYIDLADRASTESIEVRPGLVVDLDANGMVVGIDIDRASALVDLPALDEEAVPFHRVAGRP